MKKANVLKNLPELKNLKKRLNELDKLIPKLEKEADDLFALVEGLDGVTLYEGFPVKAVSLSNGVEVRSGCDEVKRYAFVGQTTLGGKFSVVTYLDSLADGTTVEGEHKKADAMKLANEWVASGKKDSAKRGRPKKD